jgi:hypothetical protein
VHVARFVVRVWLPDRPGALGAVASRIGAVRGDLIGIDILEQGGGRAIDELIVTLPSPELVGLLVAELGQVDGVDVEDIRPVADTVPDPRLDALETAAFLVEQTTVPSLLDTLVGHACHDLEAAWATVVDLDRALQLAAVGVAPAARWLCAFVTGSLASLALTGGATGPAGGSGPDDVAWAPFPHADLALVLGRQGRPFRARERRQLAALARIADWRWAELELRHARAAHPSTAV